MDNSHNIFLTSSIEPMQIDVNNLRVGMYVCKLDKPWLESSFLFQGFELKNQADIDAIKKECHFVFIDIEKQNTALKNLRGSKTRRITTGTLEKNTLPHQKLRLQKKLSTHLTLIDKLAT